MKNFSKFPTNLSFLLIVVFTTSFTSWKLLRVPLPISASSDLKQTILAQMQNASDQDFIPGELLVKYKPYIVQTQNLDEPADILQTSGILYSQQQKLFNKTPEEAPEIFNIFKITLQSNYSVRQAVTKLNNRNEVEYAEPNYKVSAFFTPNDPSFSQQWGMKKIESEKAWDINQGNPSIVAAVVDTGAQSSHPDLTNKILNGSSDCAGHGTHVAGIMAADTNNNVGVVGVGFNVKLRGYSVLDCGGEGNDAAIISGIQRATDDGNRVINLSLGRCIGGPGAVCDAVNYAWNKGTVVVAAAANANPRCPPLPFTAYPAACDNAIAVSSTDSSDSKSSFSNYANWVDVGAPGSSIYSTWTGNGYDTASGTSMASPHVAGLAALVFSTCPNLTNTQVRQIIESNVDVPAGWNINNWGKGRINAFKAVQAGQAACGATPPPTLTPTPNLTPTLSLTPVPTQKPTSPPGPSATAAPPSLTPTPTSVPWPPYCRATDLNADRVVDSFDLTVVLFTIHGRGISQVDDFNNDKIVNIIDAVMLINCWGFRY